MKTNLYPLKIYFAPPQKKTFSPVYGAVGRNLLL